MMNLNAQSFCGMRVLFVVVVGVFGFSKCLSYPIGIGNAITPINAKPSSAIGLGGQAAEGSVQAQPDVSLRTLGVTLPPKLGKPIVPATSSSSHTENNGLPEFLLGAPPDIVTEYKRILRQRAVTYSEKVRQVQTLVGTRLDNHRQELFRDFLNASPVSVAVSTPTPIRRIESVRTKADSFSHVSSILQDPRLSEADRWRQVVAIYDGLSHSMPGLISAKTSNT